jgi:hypothetical protein
LNPPSDFAGSLALLFTLACVLLALAWLSRQVSVQIQQVTYRLVRSTNYMVVTLFLLLLPGVIIHEAAHWVAAWLLGLKPGRFRVWPKAQGKHIGLGSVSVKRGHLWQDSLVGLAPLLIGSLLITLIVQEIFHAEGVAVALSNGQLVDSVLAFRQAFQAPDSTLWAYLLFAIGNAMMPSASDREPVMPLLLYMGLALTLYIILGLPLAPFASVLDWFTPALQALVSALIFTVFLDLAVLAVLFIVRLVLGQPVIHTSRAKAKGR